MGMVRIPFVGGFHVFLCVALFAVRHTSNQKPPHPTPPGPSSADETDSDELWRQQPWNIIRKPQKIHITPIHICYNVWWEQNTKKNVVRGIYIYIMGIELRMPRDDSDLAKLTFYSETNVNLNSHLEWCRTPGWAPHRGWYGIETKRSLGSDLEWIL